MLNFTPIVYNYRLLLTLALLLKSSLVCANQGSPSPTAQQSIDNEQYTLDSQIHDCILQKLDTADENTRILELREICKQEISQADPNSPLSQERSKLAKRLISEYFDSQSRYSLIPHRRNYILPVTYNSNPNLDTWSQLTGSRENFEELEAKYQLSTKVPLSDPLFNDRVIPYFGFTVFSLWQVYSDETSRPFRETNYIPELFAIYKPKNNPFESSAEILFLFGVQHQSNGRNEPISRSWNRINLGVVFDWDSLVLALSPWYRLPEKNSEDENPDIEKYMGYFEVNMAYRTQNHEFSMMVRNNMFSGNGGSRGAVELGWSFPLWHRLRGYVQYFNGYGESMIDFDHSVNRVGIGLLLSDVL
ncbi:MAG: phospholipase A [Pseudomonadota bacterium]